MLCILVEPVGIEPTVFLMSLIYSQLPSPLGTRLLIEFESSSTTLLLPFPRINKLERGSVRHLGYLSNVPYIAAEDSRLPLFYTIKPFEEAYNSVTFSC